MNWWNAVRSSSGEWGGRVSVRGVCGSVMWVCGGRVSVRGVSMCVCDMCVWRES